MSKHFWHLLVFFCFSFQLGAADGSALLIQSHKQSLAEAENSNESELCTALPNFKVFYELCHPYNNMGDHGNSVQLHHYAHDSNVINRSDPVIPNNDANRNASAVRVKKELKRKREDDITAGNNEKRLRILKDNIKSKTPVMLAFFHGILKKQGGEFIDQETGIIEINNLEILLKFIEKNVRKKSPTTNQGHRLKAIAKWFSDFPEKDRFNKKYRLNIKSTKIASYRKLFSFAD